MATPIDRLTKAKDCLELLDEMKPKNFITYQDNVEKVNGLLRIYNKTIDILECAKVDAETTGDKMAHGLTLRQIEDRLSECLSEKLFIEESTNFDPGSRNINEVSLESLRLYEASGSGTYKMKTKCNKCDYANYVEKFTGTEVCECCSCPIFPSVHQWSNKNTSANTDEKKWEFSNLEANPLVTPAIIPGGSSVFLDKEPIVMSVIYPNILYHNWDPLHEKYENLHQNEKEFIYPRLLWFEYVHKTLLATEMHISVGDNKQYSVMLKKHVDGKVPQASALLDVYNNFVRTVLNVRMNETIRIVAPDEERYDCTVLEIQINENGFSAKGPGFETHT
jgi:hypothetical protein